MSQPAPLTPALERQLPADDIIVLRDVTWSDYQRLPEIRGERPVPRADLPRRSAAAHDPSRPHGSLKSMIGRLVEAWCLEKGVGITPYGSWTLESKESERGVEPDECDVLGDAAEPERCDLAIELIWSSGGLDKLEVYAKLGVKEVWVWKAGAIGVFTLRDERYPLSITARCSLESTSTCCFGSLRSGR